MCAGPRGTHSGAMETTQTQPQDSNDQTADHTTGPQGPSYPSRPPIVRPVRGRMLAGVAAGAADYLGVDPTIVRIAPAGVAAGGAGGGRSRLPRLPGRLAALPGRGCPPVRRRRPHQLRQLSLTPTP